MRFQVSSALALGAALCAFGISQAQIPAPAPTPSSNAPLSPASSKEVPRSGATAPDYSREAGLIERMDREYNYAADGTGSELVTASVRVSNDAAVKRWSVLDFAYASAAEHMDVLYVRIHHADNTVAETPSTDAQDMPAAITREAPFYSDLKEKQIPVRGLHAGDRLEYSVRKVRTKPEAPGRLWGTEAFFQEADGVVVLEESVQLRVPKSTHVTVWSPAHKPETRDEGTDEFYRWTSSQPVAMASLSEKQLAQIKADRENDTVDGGRFPDIAWTNFKSWEDVGAWYRGMEGSRTEPDDEIRAKVTELTAGKTTPEEKAQAIYSFVGPQVRYIGVAFGIGRYQPHEANDVLHNQYGDCKDKHTLLAAMLTAAGFKVNAVLIGAGIRFNDAVPSPGSFNHLITQVSIDGKDVWLDSTSELAPYRLLLPVIRGKQALVIPSSGPATVQTTPKDAPYPEEVTFQAIGSLDDKGTSHSHMTMVDHADEEVVLRSAVRSISPSQWDELMQRFSQGLGYSGKVSNAEFSRPEDLSTPFRMTYDYEREKNGDWDNLRILPQILPLNMSLVDEENPPLTPIELGGKRTQIDHTELALPAGWGADLPPAVHASASFATLDKTYRFENGKIITDRKLTILQDKVPATEWRSYQNWAKSASLDGESYIQLTRAGGMHAAGKTVPEAQALIMTATQLERQQQWDEARAKLDEAKELNPSQAYLWSNYGFLAMNYGKLNEAKEDFDKEIANHPDEDRPYELLANVLEMQRKPDEARATLKKLVALNPDSVEGNTAYARLLLGQKDLAGAETALRHVVTPTSTNPSASVLLGRVLLRENKKSEAEPVLRKVIDDSHDAEMLNDAAYELADQSLDLTMAEEAAKKSLSLIQEQQDAAGSGGSERATLQRTTLLIATWDTYGWILYREGKYADALPWIRGAWSNGPNEELGLHLGMVLKALNRLTEAEEAFDLAEGARHGPNADAIGKEIDAQRQALRKTGIAVQVQDARKALQAQRTFQVPRKEDKPRGSATVEFEVSKLGVSNARFVEGGEGLESVLTEVSRIDFKANVPPQSEAKLTRRGVLACSSQESCMLVLVPPAAAASEVH